MNENNLCNYYSIDKTPGIKAKGKFISQRYAYLDDEGAIKKLVQFSSETQTNITFSIPQMHCSSCIYLLENLHRIDPGILKSQTNFQRKEVFIIFDPQKITLRKVVELLAFIGYEPYISLQDASVKRSPVFNRVRIYKIGVAGFCFANIMMLSFPEYFSSGNIEQAGLKQTFSLLNFVLSVPVLFFCASGFFISAWKGLRQRFLNIDAPIALALLVTFFRSYYEIITGHGAGYLDSGSGIVFFMLVGRWFQDKTYDSFSFDRDYRSYFPLGVTMINEKGEKNIPVTALKKGDRIIIRNEEMIPTDAVLMKGEANIDYSFVSGEDAPVNKSKGALIYAGGKQLGNAIELETVNEVSQSYITQLWNNEVFTAKKNTETSFIHPWSRYFTITLFTVAAATALFWGINDPSKLLPSVTAVLIVACPCSLLLATTFTYGNMLRIFGKNKLYLKNASVIETLARINTIVFDKTGTITHPHSSFVKYVGTPLSSAELSAVKYMAKQSSHPLSKVLASSIKDDGGVAIKTNHFKEYNGSGIEAMMNNIPIRLGSSGFMNEKAQGFTTHDTGSHVHVMVNNVHLGHFNINNQYREGVDKLVEQLRSKPYQLHVLSGDNDTEKNKLERLFGSAADIRFGQSPQNKLDHIQFLQKHDKKVLMLGDGLNDAGALMQSNAGIAVSDNTARFTPACDAIIDGQHLNQLDKFLAFAGSGKKIITATFILSLLYNMVGLSFAVQGLLSPMVAAILMPASSISIVLLVTWLTSISAHSKGL